MNIEQITQRLHAIRDRNDWQRFHSPKNLAMAASVEMAELVEIFQWLSEDQSRQLPADQLAHAGQEVGDVILYLLLLCSELGLDLEQVVRAKLADSEKGFYAMAFLLALFGAVAVQKNVRDLAATGGAAPMLRRRERPDTPPSA